MLRFFRQIRLSLISQNRITKYVLYAIGEIVLVVIGILLALQVNNWNQDNMEQEELKTYVSSLIEDLEVDIAMIETIKFQNEEIIMRIDSLGAYISNKEIGELSNIDILCLTLNKPHRPYKWNRATLEELKSSGRLRIINNDAIIKSIAKYDSETYHLDVDYENDKIQFEKCTQLMAKIVNTNYDNFDLLYKMLLPKDNRRDYNLFETEPYVLADKQNLRLISQSMDDVKIMVNEFNILKSYLKIRTDDELPKLRMEGEALISKLKENYHN